MVTYADSRYSKMKYAVSFLRLTLVLFFIGLVGLSVASFIQTEIAFRPMNDPTIQLLGIPIGSLLSYFMAFTFQYGQNAALFIRSEFCTDKDIINFAGVKISEKQLALIAFVLTAIVDAGTNVLWFYDTIDAGAVAVGTRQVILRVFGYMSMVLVVFVEEILGWVADAISRTSSILKSIENRDKTMTSSTKKTSTRKPASKKTTTRKQAYTPPTGYRRPNLKQMVKDSEF